MTPASTIQHHDAPSQSSDVLSSLRSSTAALHAALLEVQAAAEARRALRSGTELDWAADVAAFLSGWEVR